MKKLILTIAISFISTKIMANEIVFKQGALSGSLYQSSHKAGIPANIVTKSIKQFGRFIDFRNLKKGDKFEYIFEKKDNTSILRYASLRINNKKYEIFSTNDPEIFYSPSSNIHSKAKAEWHCSDGNKFNNKRIIVKAKKITSNNGSIFASDTWQSTNYTLEGLNARWNFGYDKSDYSYKFSFLIKPDGQGLYYDFKSKEENTPSMIMKCQKQD